MINRVLYFVFTGVFFGCSHPDSEKDDRYKGTHIIQEETPVFTSVEEIPLEYYSEEPKISIDIEEPKNILKMEKEGGVKYIWIEINGIRLRFIFDTGASSILISPSEAKVLMRQGTLTEDDFIGIEHFRDATGNITEGAVVNLRQVKIGNTTLENVTASISSSESSPLLLGQTVLERFGKIEIDNINETIIFK